MNIGDLGLVTLGSRWVRCSVNRQAPSQGVDRENRVIRGFSVATIGEALTHGVYFDSQFLDALVVAGNKNQIGIKSRFDHPSASGTSIGTALGRARNFSRDGNQVRADLYLLDSASIAPQGDLADYVMTLSEEDPAAFGTSVVVMLTERKGPNGKTQIAGVKGQVGDDLKLVDLKKFLAVDVVDDPAANPNGMFSSDSGASEIDLLAAKTTEFLDKYFQSRGLIVLPKSEFMRSPQNPSTQNKSCNVNPVTTQTHTEDTMPPEITEEKTEPEVTPVVTPTETAPTETAAASPEVVQPAEPVVVPAESAPAEPTVAASASVSEAEIERSRVLTILSSAFNGQDALVQELIKAGTPVQESLQRLITDAKSKPASTAASTPADKLEALRSAHGKPAGWVEASAATPLPFEDQCKADWDRDEAIQKKFSGSFEGYMRYRNKAK